MLRHTLSFALAIVTTLLSVSCSSDSKDTNNGASGAGGTGGAGGAGGAGGTESMPGVACGNNRCLPRAGMTEEACCIDQFTSTCGIRRQTQCAEPPPMEDPRCPSVQVPVIGMLASCCTNGDCGITAPPGFGGGGCTELGEAQRQANMFTGDGGFQFDGGFGFDAGPRDGGFGITFPPPQRCDR